MTVSLFTARRPNIQVRPNSGSKKIALFTPDLQIMEKNRNRVGRITEGRLLGTEYLIAINLVLCI